MKTYDIKSEFYEIQKLLENEEFNEETGELIDNSETIKELLNEIEAERDSKADNIAYLIKEADDTENSLKAEIDRLNKRKKMFARQQDSLKQLLDYLLGGKKLKTDKFTYSYRNSQSVNITDENLIPAEFLNVKEVITPDKKLIDVITPDKKLIKEKLANSEDVAGAEIVVKKSLNVR